MKQIRFVMVIVIIILGYSILQSHLRQNPITITHPFPGLSRKYPIVKILDNWFYLTAGISWYKVTSRSGKQYFAQAQYYYTPKTGSCRYWRVMDAILRDKWTYLTDNEFYYLFGSPGEGIGYSQIEISSILLGGQDKRRRN